MKFGADFKIDRAKDELIITCHGQTYLVNDEMHHTEMDIRMKFKDENKSFAELFGKSESAKKVHVISKGKSR